MEQKNLIIKHITINNFKGIKNFEVDLGADVVISGANATGKSTIFDAILWALFGKNSQDAKDFSIKNTTDLSLNRAEHSVELLLDVNSEDVTLKRVFKEKWTKRRGSEEMEFKGHETLFFWNEVPLNASSYASKVSELIPENQFKQVTNPLYVNTIMSEKDRREMLIKMGGEISEDKVINGTPAFRELFEKIQGHKTLEDFSKEIAYKKTNLKKQLADIPARIDELIHSNPKTQDWKEIENEIEKKNLIIKDIDKQIDDLKAEHDKTLSSIKSKQNEAISASKKMAEIENDLIKKGYAEAAQANKDISEAKYFLSEIRRSLKQNEAQNKEYQDHKSKLEVEIQKQRELFSLESLNEFVFNPELCQCPTCKRPFYSSVVEEKEVELSKEFNEQKRLRLLEIRGKGKRMADEIKYSEDQINNILSNTADLKRREDAFIWAETAVEAKPKPIDLSKNSLYQSLKATAEQIIEVKQIDYSELKDVKSSILEAIDELKSMLTGRIQIEKNAVRIEELKSEEKKYAQELSSLEKQEFTIAEFQKTKMNMIESSINRRFETVRWKMFDTQINGGERPCCIATVKGVPFPDVNHADQIKAGMDVVNAISEYYQIYAPIIIENAECINVIPNTKSQLIKLVVTNDKELVITNN